MSLSSSPVFETAIRSLPLVSRGKVRDIYAVGADKLLIVATDRLSAFDVILPDPIPKKGQVLTAVANFWFEKLAHILPNQLTGIDPQSVVAPEEAAQVIGRAVVARRLQPLPIEAVARGHLIGSGWKDYQQTGAVCGLPLPAGLKLAARLPEPIFTPATKAEIGEHDENISFSEAQELCAARLANVLEGAGKSGEAICGEARDAALALYREAAAHALGRGIIIADTKFEFGVDASGTLYLIDEALTPDSSRFWPADNYREGENPASFDKQFVRDYLETLDWNKKAPGPRLPAEVIRRTSEKYVEACERLTGEKLPT
ncbi:MAG: phosphoribosylaminoimidazolesuccinocarboxamide synthase [Zoogloeaceae bacterium]|jgi:phosphoribosylaminoimidazole-succinocarboxamide synthase|nr:phosphoribosylaminoimidazolesuccinocarboxamide synthase [Zoogloeaceae bacterium]